jgi:signal transduction histidine kinase
MNRIWNYISYLGLKDYDKSLSNRNIITANRINFIFICIFILLNILTAVLREIDDSVYTIHTKKLLYFLIFCLLNFFFSYKMWHNVTKISLIIAPSLILILLPIFYGEVQELDFIYAPLLILAISFIPPLILYTKLTNKLYLLASIYFLLLVIFLDNILVVFSAHELSLVKYVDHFHFFYKIVFIPTFLFIQTTMYYLRSINYSFENELITINDKLKANIEELKTTQQFLVQSEKMASLGTLAAGIAHEINNPLNFIKGGVSFLENYIKDNFPGQFEEVRPAMEGIDTGVKRAAVIVNSLNQYNSSDVLPFTKCNVNEIIDDCLVILQNQYKNRIEVQKLYTEVEYIFEGNEGKLHQAFLNILANASHAIDDNGQVKIKTDIVTEQIHITISDNGHGIPQENLKKVFDPFFTTKDPGKGTGLGLSITYNIIK